MAEQQSKYSQDSSKKTMIFFIVLVAIIAILSFVALYIMHKQSSVLIQ